MKRILICLIAIAATILAFPSCASQAETASMRIVLENGSSRLIAPEGIPLEVKKYEITCTGPDSKKITITTARTSTTLDGLAIGEWTIEAKGLNEEGRELVRGETTFTLNANSSTCVIRLDELPGQGTLDFTITWDTDRVVAPKLELELTRQSEDAPTDIDLGGEPLDGSVSISVPDLASGSYILQGRLYSNDILLSGFVEAVRIVGNASSSKELEFSLDMLPSAPGSLQLLNESGIPVSCTIEGIAEEVEAGKTVTATLVPGDGSLKNYHVEWYLDGEHIAKGNEVEFSPSSGIHRLDAVAYTDKIGSYGSTGITFSSTIRTAEGIPGNRVSVSSGLELGGNTLVHFLPDGRFLLISQGSHTMQLCELKRNTIDVAGTWRSSDEGMEFLLDAPVTASSALIDRSNVALLVATDEPAITHLNYDVETTEITFIEDDGGIAADFPPYNSYSVTSFAEPCFYNSNISMFAFLGEVNSGGSAFFYREVADTPQSNGDMFAYDIHPISTSYASSPAIAGVPTFTNVSSAVWSPDGSKVLLGNGEGSVVNYSMDGNALYETDRIDSGLDRAKYVGLDRMHAVGDRFAVLSGDDFLASYDWNSLSEISYISDGSPFADIVLNEATGNIYAVDGTNCSVNVYSIADDGSLSFETSVPTDNAADSLKLSLDGGYLVAYSADSPSALEIFRISR